MIRIITDSMSDILVDEAEKLQVKVLPLHLMFGTESFLDGVTIDRATFYRRLETVTELPKTSQIPPETFESAYQEALNEGVQVLVITGSSELSGTYQSAVLARDMIGAEDSVYIVDSLTASLGESLLVYEAVRLRDAGESIDVIYKTLKTIVGQQMLLGQVDELKYLVMGGRLSSVGAKVGTALKFKPMLRLKKGKLEMGGLVRGTQKAYAWMREQLENYPPDMRFPLHFASANAPEALEKMKEYIMNHCNVPVVTRTLGIGAVIGTHTGPGCIAMCWIQAPKKG